MTSVIDSYKGAALVSLFDCIATLAEVLQDKIRNPDIANLLLPILNQRMRDFNQNDRRLLPLFETYEQVICAVGTDLIEPYV